MTHDFPTIREVIIMHDAAVQPVLCRLARTQGTGQESRRDGVHVEDASAARRTSSLLNEI